MQEVGRVVKCRRNEVMYTLNYFPIFVRQECIIPEKPKGNAIYILFNFRLEVTASVLGIEMKCQAFRNRLAA